MRPAAPSDRPATRPAPWPCPPGAPTQAPRSLPLQASWPAFPPRRTLALCASPVPVAQAMRNAHRTPRTRQAPDAPPPNHHARVLRQDRRPPPALRRRAPPTRSRSGPRPMLHRSSGNGVGRNLEQHHQILGFQFHARLFAIREQRISARKDVAASRLSRDLPDIRARRQTDAGERVHERQPFHPATIVADKATAVARRYVSFGTQADGSSTNLARSTRNI